uniref:Uncharacterized protein n=1 Tax=Alexandrium monilatum TaxID=311494 RepID=A0A7S4QFF2_9DINO
MWSMAGVPPYCFEDEAEEADPSSGVRDVYMPKASVVFQPGVEQDYGGARGCYARAAGVTGEAADYLNGGGFVGQQGLGGGGSFYSAGAGDMGGTGHDVVAVSGAQPASEDEGAGVFYGLDACGGTGEAACFLRAQDEVGPVAVDDTGTATDAMMFYGADHFQDWDIDDEAAPSPCDAWNVNAEPWSPTETGGSRAPGVWDMPPGNWGAAAEALSNAASLLPEKSEYGERWDAGSQSERMAPGVWLPPTRGSSWAALEGFRSLSALENFNVMGAGLDLGPEPNTAHALEAGTVMGPADALPAALSVPALAAEAMRRQADLSPAAGASRSAAPLGSTLDAAAPPFVPGAAPALAQADEAACGEEEARYELTPLPSEWPQLQERACAEEGYFDDIAEVMRSSPVMSHGSSRASITSDPRLYKVMDNISPEECDLFSPTNLVWMFAKLILHPTPSLG